MKVLKTQEFIRFKNRYGQPKNVMQQDRLVNQAIATIVHAAGNNCTDYAQLRDPMQVLFHHCDLDSRIVLDFSNAPCTNTDFQHYLFKCFSSHYILAKYVPLLAIFCDFELLFPLVDLVFPYCVTKMDNMSRKNEVFKGFCA